MAMPKQGYPEMAVRPQIIRNAPLLTFFLSADAAVLGQYIPRPLTRHPSGRIILNMWFLPNPEDTTGFGEPGPVGVTYLATEIAGEEGASADHATHFPGRLWLEHWSSSVAVRRYAHQASGLEIVAGDTSLDFDDGVVTAKLRLGDRAVVTARARVGRGRLRTTSGHSIYYAEREADAGRREVARFAVPWISDLYDADEPAVDFAFAEDASALRFVKNGGQPVIGVTFRRITLVPYLSSNVL
jgi:hypothetical protein